MANMPPHSFEQLIAWRTCLQMRQEDKLKWRALIDSRADSLKIKSLDEYYSLLTSDTTESKSEWHELVGVLTTGESYFFRDKGQFSIMRNLILPEIIERRQKERSLRIWSAGCSTGEEPYSIAILIDEMMPKLEDWDIFILGTDINEKTIEKAAKGVFTQWSFRMADPDLRKRYFRPRYDSWEIDKKIREMVNFRYSNLMENNFPDSASGIHDMDIILCRNVFIYFNSFSVAVVLEKLTDTLRDKGWLITGHGELHAQSLGILRPRIFPESVVYQKSSESAVRGPELKEKEKKTSEVEKEISYEFRIEKLSIAQPPVFTPAKKEFPKPPTIKEPEISIPKPESPLPSTHGAEIESFYQAAEEYADKGQYDKAEAECRKALEIDKTAARPYFLLAHIAEMKGSNEDARELFKKVIYLDHSFAAAYLELGALYERENDSERAKKMRATAMEILKTLPPDAAIEPYTGMTARELLEYVKKML